MLGFHCTRLVNRSLQVEGHIRLTTVLLASEHAEGVTLFGSTRLQTSILLAVSLYTTADTAVGFSSQGSRRCFYRWQDR